MTRFDDPYLPEGSSLDRVSGGRVPVVEWLADGAVSFVCQGDCGEDGPTKRNVVQWVYQVGEHVDQDVALAFEGPEKLREKNMVEEFA